MYIPSPPAVLLSEADAQRAADRQRRLAVALGQLSANSAAIGDDAGALAAAHESDLALRRLAANGNAL